MVAHSMKASDPNARLTSNQGVPSSLGRACKPPPEKRSEVSNNPIESRHSMATTRSRLCMKAGKLGDVQQMPKPRSKSMSNGPTLLY